MLINNFSYCTMETMDIAEQHIFKNKVYSFLFMLNLEYPNFSHWYNSLFDTNGLLKNNRHIIICFSENCIAGVSILKDETNEKKICTLRVAPLYQQMGIGKSLIEKSFEILECEKPLITIHISKYHEFKSLFQRYGFTVEQQAQSYYGLLKSELSYNGILTNQMSIINNSFIHRIAFRIESKLYDYDPHEIVKCSIMKQTTKQSLIYI